MTASAKSLAHTARLLWLFLFFLPEIILAQDKEEIFVQQGRASSVNAVAFSPDGRTLASSNSHGAINFWDIASGRELRALRACRRSTPSPSPRRRRD